MQRINYYEREKIEIYLKMKKKKKWIASKLKGEVENINKLIRQYLPKNIDFSKITNKDII